MHHENFMVMMLPIINATFGSAVVFVTSELGQRMTDAFNEIDFILSQLDWYLFPGEMQRMLPTIIADAQQPVELKCFGSIGCSREVFKNVSVEQ